VDERVRGPEYTQTIADRHELIYWKELVENPSRARSSFLLLHNLAAPVPPRSSARRRGWVRCNPDWLGNPPYARVHLLSACPASSALIMRARAFRAWLEPMTPPLRNARRDTGFPAASNLRAITRA
jgi:hypothetical protein